MNEVANELLKDVLDSYAQRDAERAREVWGATSISTPSKTRCFAIS